jgi:hypothetical protein
MLSIMALAACSTSEDTNESTPVAKFAASQQTTSELGVTIWEVHPDGAGVDRLVGRDASGERVVEMTLHRNAPGEDVVDMETDAGTLRLTPDGVASASSADARRLGLDVGKDLGKDAIRLDGVVGPTVTTYAVTDPREQAKGDVSFGWNLFSQFQRIFVGGTCHANTTRYNGVIVSDYGALGIWTGWQWSSPNTDCNAIFDMYVNGGHWDNFHWRVYNAPVNVAAGRPASQSTTDFGGFPSRATDGNIDGNWGNNSVTHTSWEYRPWWQVDLGSTKTISGVVLFNRTDCCTERLADFDIQTSNDGVQWDTAVSEYGPTGPRTELALASPQGRFVRVQLRGANYLSLAEVQVYAQ